MDERIKVFDDKMRKTYEHLESDYQGIRAGRANPHVLDKLRVDYYGTPTPIQQVGNITIPEARMIQIAPWEKTLIKSIEKAILASDIGITPSNDGSVIRLVFPELTEERRKDLVKEVKKKAEEGKVAVRNIRRDGNDSFKKLAKAEVSEDEIKELTDKLQKLTDQYIKDIDKLMEGAAYGRTKALETSYEENPALLYAAVRNILLRKGKHVEIVANYEPSLHYVSEWWKQLYGESEGKDQKGIFPASVDLTTDLHSMGQFIQDGSRIMFETVLNVETSRSRVEIKEEPADLDGLNYLAGKDMDFVNKSAMNGTILAHTDGSVPNLMVCIPEQNEFYLGQLFYFFEFACGVSGYLLGVNPFNQPGVESYKKNMFALLGKPGYEAEKEALLKRL